MDDDWDLHAVVRGCAAAAVSTNTASAAANNDDPFPSFSYMSFHDDQTSFDFPDLVVDDTNGDPFQGLREIYQEFCVDDDAPPPPQTTTAPAADIAADTNWAISANPSANFFQPRQEIAQIKPPQHSQENIQFNNNNNNHRPGSSSSSHNFPAAINPQPIRPRRRKNQQMKMVRQMTQEELSADSWAWRKYGQKPIKGSPYPRNYYRCSTSKGCAARKQVERSPNDPGIFVVSYTGEHTHPRPTHRSSLAGSTRSKLSSSTATAKNSNNNNNAAVSHHQKSGSISSSSPPPAAAAASGSSFSPNTPLMEGGAATAEKDVEMAEEENNINLMISNDMIMNDDDDDILFKGFQDSDHDSGGGGGGGGNLFSSGLLSSPPWTPTSSAVV
ncbi:hypothetical protein ABFS82_06G027300 [Erythranthe guttata]|uniref:WRKY domain-containing protein n=1 Tax=Erythranthe guttata TaxID=4155 RepID=A0A022QC02_ERYGU|nr:PREDICTED: probable WRKY transcription factor 27 [Erythranthe guttata]EYU25159.1 hypothetical protein MIMGU_mgv1a023144mg [Erythranthe guttata]|eukprot:XP_012852038.1 PREDICTED: probable WRKY transcription factor 27 [Erythranthe guttata]